MKRRTFIKSIIGSLSALIFGESLIPKSPIIANGTEAVQKWDKFNEDNKGRNLHNPAFIRLPIGNWDSCSLIVFKHKIVGITTFNDKLYVATDDGIYVMCDLSKMQGFKKLET